MMRLDDTKLWVCNIERFAIHDGPGIRTVVFFQGCPLHCQWCANPESQDCGPVLLHLKGKCTGCGACGQVCPEKAVSIIRKKAVIDRRLCANCGTCVSACVNGANRIIGQKCSLQDIFDVVMRDRAYYETSSGGVTFSGGETMLYAEELLPLLQRLKAEGISTAVETCGAVPYEKFRIIQDSVDVFLYDIKSMEPEILRQYTGADMNLVLGNLRELSLGAAEKIVIRVPVIPTVNDEIESVHAIFREAASDNIRRVDLLPYHTLGVTKYHQMGRDYHLRNIAPMKPERLQPFRKLGEVMGIEVHIGGDQR